VSPNLPVPVVAGAVLDPPAPSAPVPAQADTDAQLVAALAWNVPSCPGRGLRLALGDVGLSLLRRGRPALLGSISSHSLSHHPAVF
jgi:hypothetical protein